MNRRSFFGLTIGVFVGIKYAKSVQRPGLKQLWMEYYGCYIPFHGIELGKAWEAGLRRFPYPVNNIDTAVCLDAPTSHEYFPDTL